MKIFLSIVAVLSLLLSACNDNDDLVKTVNKNGGIEISLSTTHIDSLKDLLTTHYIVWNKGVKVREFDKKDTIPSLGTFTPEAENDNGDVQYPTVKQDYEFYVTVK